MLGPEGMLKVTQRGPQDPATSNDTYALSHVAKFHAVEVSLW